MRFLAQLALPSNLALFLFGAGILAALWPRARRWSPLLLGACGAVVFGFSSGKVAAALMSPLEYAYPAIHDARGHPEVRSIVVLTAWAADDPNMPLSSRLNASGAFRVLMALKLHRDCPDCRVIVSGSKTTARIMADTLHELGIPRDIVIQDEAQHTDDSAESLGTTIGREPFFLVTSAGHLPRSMRLFARRELHPIPVPVDYQLPRDWRDADLAPSPFSLGVSDLAIHEYLGILRTRLSD